MIKTDFLEHACFTTEISELKLECTKDLIKFLRLKNAFALKLPRR